MANVPAGVNNNYMKAFRVVFSSLIALWLCVVFIWAFLLKTYVWFKNCYVTYFPYLRLSVVYPKYISIGDEKELQIVAKNLKEEEAALTLSIHSQGAFVCLTGYENTNVLFAGSVKPREQFQGTLQLYLPLCPRNREMAGKYVRLNLAIETAREGYELSLPINIALFPKLQEIFKLSMRCVNAGLALFFTTLVGQIGNLLIRGAKM